MNTQKQTHTPGPWEVGYDGDGTPIVTFEARDICTVEKRDGEANARLIAAAPEMLEIIELSIARAESDLRHWPVKDLGNFEHLSLRTHLGKLQAVTDKAGVGL